MSSQDRRTHPKAAIETFGQRLTRLREDAGLSQSALSRRIGASQSSISQIEAGERSPSYGMLVQLADALGVTLAYLIGGAVEQLSPAEEVHFRRYRALPADAKRELDAYAGYLQTKYTSPRSGS